MWQGAQCSFLECCLTEISRPRHLTWYSTKSHYPSQQANNGPPRALCLFHSGPLTAFFDGLLAYICNSATDGPAHTSGLYGVVRVKFTFYINLYRTDRTSDRLGSDIDLNRMLAR